MTHITGCYRLHPVEWNGEAAGYLAAFCLEHGLKPKEVRNRRHVPAVPRLLVQQGIELIGLSCKRGESMATIREVAERSSVFISTSLRVMNAPETVSPKA